MTRKSKPAWAPFVRIRAFARNDEGATAIEYALIAGGLSIAIVFAVGTLGDTLLDMYTAVANMF